MRTLEPRVRLGLLWGESTSGEAVISLPMDSERWSGDIRLLASEAPLDIELCNSKPGCDVGDFMRDLLELLEYPKEALLAVLELLQHNSRSVGIDILWPRNRSPETDVIVEEREFGVDNSKGIVEVDGVSK
jgi:hypothetical protein